MQTYIKEERQKKAENIIQLTPDKKEEDRREWKNVEEEVMNEIRKIEIGLRKTVLNNINRIYIHIEIIIRLTELGYE